VPNVEVDKIEWVDVKTARHFLTHDEDRELLNEFVSKERYTTALILLRHAKAIKRSDWNDYDLDRPLAADGLEQSQQLVNQLRPFGIEGIFSSDALRCYSTVEPIADALNLRVHVTNVLNEETFEENNKAALNYVRQLMKFDGNQLVSGHNPIIPYILTKIARVEYSADDFSPADAWVLYHQGEKVVAVEFLSRPKL
jgi:8-oxo-dGTP diphosphatase